MNTTAGSRVLVKVEDLQMYFPLGGSYFRKPDSFIHAVDGIDFEIREKSSLALVGESGYGKTTAGKLRTPRLWLRFNGFGTVELRELDTQKLQVELLGSGLVEASGFSREQQVVINGIGKYSAPGLHTYAARLRMKGAGSATIWAQHELDVTLFGPGKVSYYGTPRYKRQRLAPMARIEHLGERGPVPQEHPLAV